jgi:beta-ribofuranosylaminobenzene 5'-phosphate synthase
MTDASASAEIVVSAPARLHFGMLDPAGLGARRFGGFGVAVQAPRVVVAVRRARPGSPEPVTVSGPQADRAAAFARRARSELEIADALALEVREAIPPHMGLGSGTKLGLAIARGIADLAGRSMGPQLLARVSGRGARSSIGAWTFAAPGLVVEAGVDDDGELSPLLLRCAMPERWRCVLALPAGREGLSGTAEERFFGELRRSGSVEPPVARLLLTSVLPALKTGDIEEFGAGLSEIQRRIGEIFASQQGGVFHPSAAPLVEALTALGVGAVGQSSWGPTVYGIVDGPERAAEVAAALRLRAPGAEVSAVDFDRDGAVCERRERRARA